MYIYICICKHVCMFKLHTVDQKLLRHGHAAGVRLLVFRREEVRGRARRLAQRVDVDTSLRADRHEFRVEKHLSQEKGVHVNNNGRCVYPRAPRYIQGAPLRLIKPLSDQFPVRVCSCTLCI